MANYSTKSQFGVKKPYNTKKKRPPRFGKERSFTSSVSSVSYEQIRVAINLISYLR